MYPTPNCLSCELQGIVVKENTEHLLDCQSRQSKAQAAHTLHQKTKRIISEAISGMIPDYFDYLPDLALPRDGRLNECQQYADQLAANSPLKQFMQTYKKQHAMFGLIPKCLKKLLQSAGAKGEKLKKALSEIAWETQKVIHDDLRNRRKEIERYRNAKELRHRFVLGMGKPMQGQSGDDPPGDPPGGDSPEPAEPQRSVIVRTHVF